MARPRSCLLLVALAPGLACEYPDELAPAPASGDSPFGVAMDALGTELLECTDAGSALSGSTLTLNLAAGDDAILSVAGGKLRVNSWQCRSAAGGVDLTTDLVHRLVLNGSASGANTVLIDLLPGAFGGLFGPVGGITINAPANGTLSFGARGSASADLFRVAQQASGNDLYFDLGAGPAGDVKLVGDPYDLSFTLNDGNDSFNAQDITSMSFLGATVPTRAVVSEPLTVYGGPGNDTLEGGNGDDTLDGGDGDDLFTSNAAGGDGADVYRGGPGIDTVDYSTRTAGVTVDIDPGHTRAFVEGAQLADESLPAGTALVLSVGASGPITYTSAGASGSSAILAELNAVAAFAAVAVASQDDRGHLVIEAKSSGQTLTISSDPRGLIGGTVSRSDSAQDLADADDGTTGAGEHDDVKSDVENLNGGLGDDVLTGSSSPNVINGNGGNDDICGGPGGDCSSDVDHLAGGAGDDIFRLGTSPNCADIVDGGAGRDTADYQLRSGDVNVSLDNLANDGTGELDDVKSTVEIVLGGGGNDYLSGSSGADELHGGPGADELHGGAGNDTLVGGTGNDELYGEAGDDFIDEASATDGRYLSSFSAFGGQDVIHGGAGLNTCDFRRGGTTGASYTSCYTTGSSACPASLDDGLDPDDLTNCNHLILDGGDDIVVGSDGDDTIEAGGGADSVNGGLGNDVLYGEAGDDALSGGAGNDTLDGGADQTRHLDGGEGDDICVMPDSSNTSCEL